MYTIENEILKVIINPAGAELTSLFNKKNGLEYMWSGDAKFWGKKSPVLFPIVGTVKDNKYILEGKTYELGRHGFAREKIFSVVEQSSSSIHFKLESDDDTLKVYPFQFNLSLIYSIEENSLSVTYLVENKDARDMYFSVGAHPAFNLPLVDDLMYEDYFLLFNKTENAGRWPISTDGLIEEAAIPLLQDTNELPLSKSLFYKDAIVLKHLQSDEVEVRSARHPAGLSFAFPGFPYLGIWAAKDAPFICIEPWCGIADSVVSNQDFTEKEGIVNLPAGESFDRTWSVATW